MLLEQKLLSASNLEHAHQNGIQFTHYLELCAYQCAQQAQWLRRQLSCHSPPEVNIQFICHVSEVVQYFSKRNSNGSKSNNNKW